MAKQRYVRTNFRTDSYIEILSPDEKLIFLYLLTNESTNLCGIYEISLKRIAFETGVKLESVVSIIDKFSEDKRIFHIEWYLCITNFIKHQVSNPSVDEWIRREVLNIPQHIIDKIEKIIDWDVIMNRKLPLLKRSIGRKHISKWSIKTINDLDWHKCVICSNNNKLDLEIHHIISQKRWWDENIENLVTICHKCHNDLHKLETKDMNWYITACQSLLQPVTRCRTLLNLTLPNLTKLKHSVDFSKIQETKKIEDKIIDEIFSRNLSDQQDKIKNAQKKNEVNTRWKFWISIRNKTTGRNDVMEWQTFWDLQNFISDIDNEQFTHRCDIYKKSIDLIKEKNLWKYIESFGKNNIQDFSVTDFIKKINLFWWNIDNVFKNITQKDNINKVLRMINTQDSTTWISENNTVQEKQKIPMTDEQKQDARDILMKARSQINKNI